MDPIDWIFRLSNRFFRPYPFCHSRPDRSLSYQGRYFGLCARCMGMYLSGIIAISTFPLRNGLFHPEISIILGLLCLLPGGVDGTTQLLGDRESTNELRVATGLLLGVGVVLLSEGLLFHLLELVRVW